MASQYDIIADEWENRANDLAQWAMDTLINRKDVWGQYSVLTPTERRREGRSYKAMTLPQKHLRGNDMVSIDKLTRHFASRHQRKPQIIGLHAKSKNTTSRWMGIDIDMHDDNKTNAEDHSRRNLVGAVEWWKKLQGLGYDPLLFNSNDNGGYHLWILFAEPAPTADVFAFAKSIVTTWEETGLDEEPETFPKRVKEDSIGSWFRLPGLHHTKHHYSSVWSGDDWLDDPWLTGHAAIDCMINTVPGPPPPVKADGAEHTARKRIVVEDPVAPVISNKRRSFKRTGKATVCVDLDGVLAQRVKGKTAIGPPIDGAVEFLAELAQSSKIIIYSARFANKKAVDAEKLETRLRNWLNKNQLTFDDIHTGKGKPVAHAYIDDRAVACRPIDDGLQAFNLALDAVASLID